MTPSKKQFFERKCFDWLITNIVTQWWELTHWDYASEVLTQNIVVGAQKKWVSRRFGKSSISHEVQRNSIIIYCRYILH